MNGVVLALSAVSVSAGGREVLRDVTFSLERGQVLALVGRNGAGKSSLLRVLSGQVAPKLGTIAWLGRAQLPSGVARVKTLGVVLQHEPSASLTVREVLALACADEELQSVCLREHRLLELVERPLNELSGGERQRVALARAAAARPALYLLDEPLNHLDLVERASFLSWLERVRASAALVVAAHDPDLIARADRALLIGQGTARGCAPADALATLQASAEAAAQGMG